MDRTGYTLPELSTPANMPNASWAKTLTQSTQATEDEQYLHGPGGLDNFYAQAEGYIQTQVITRANSADPAHYAVSPFAMKIPVRKIVQWDTDGNMTTVPGPVDWRILMPVVPEYVAPVSGPIKPLFGGDHDPQAEVMDTLKAIMLKLMAMDLKLNNALPK